MGKLPTKKENNGKMTAVLGNRTTAVHIPLEDSILVRIQVPQLKAHQKWWAFALNLAGIQMGCHTDFIRVFGLFPGPKKLVLYPWVVWIYILWYGHLGFGRDPIRLLSLVRGTNKQKGTLQQVPFCLCFIKISQRYLGSHFHKSIFGSLEGFLDISLGMRSGKQE